MNAWIAKALDVGTGTVDWRATFILAAMRSASAGVTWALLQLLTGNFEGVLPFLLLGAPVGVLFMVPLALVALVGGKIFWPIGLAGIIPLIFMVSGDPLLWLVERLRPGTVPMDDFKPINGKTLLVIFNTEVVEFVQQAKEEAMATATQMGRDTFAQFREQASSKAAAFRGRAESVSQPELGLEPEPDNAAMSDQEIYDDALVKFNRLAMSNGDAEGMREQMMRISMLADAGCAIPGPYSFVADKLAQVDLADKFDLCVQTLRKGHASCDGNRAHQEEIENTFFGLGKLCWNEGYELFAFRAYMDGLDRWRQAGNIISQSSPLLPRIAFVASRMFAKKAMEQHENTDLGVELLDFCEASEIDMNLEIDVSDAPRIPN